MEIQGSPSSSRSTRAGADAEVTCLLQNWKARGQKAEEALLRATYPVLRAMSQSALSKSQLSAWCQATEIANEAYLRIREQQHFDWKNREHFYAIAACVVRRLVIDESRERAAQKRGADYDFVPIELAEQVASAGSLDCPRLADLERALKDLAREDPRSAQLVELRFFAGLTIEEAAVAMECSQATATRSWRFARAWLSNALLDVAP